MTKQERELLSDKSPYWDENTRLRADLDEAHAMIRRLIKHGEEDLWSAANANGHDTSVWDAVKVDAERLLEGRDNG